MGKIVETMGKIVEAGSDLYKIDPRSVRLNGVEAQTLLAALKGGGDDCGTYMYCGEIDQPMHDYAHSLRSEKMFGTADSIEEVLRLMTDKKCGSKILTAYQSWAKVTMDWLRGRREEGFPLVFGVAVNIQPNGKIGYSPRQIGLWQKIGY